MMDRAAADAGVMLARDRVDAACRALEACAANKVRLIETHISWVLLTDTRAYKLKKPLRLPFLDFSSLPARRFACEEELRLNARLAPSLYLGMAELRDGPGGPSFGGVGPVLDVAVCMRRFPDGALWSEMATAGTLQPQHVDAMARRICEFHAAAVVAPGESGFGSALVQQRVMQRVVDAIDAWQARATAWPADVDWRALRAWLERQQQDLAPFWTHRLAKGKVRECHGDLHLANAVQLADGPTAFDAIEFDQELRWIDVLDDIAFLAMDLMAHGLRPLAFRWLDACLEHTGDHDGLPALRYFLVGRALVRAQVGAMAAAQAAASSTLPGAADYLRLAAQLACASDPRLAVMHGLPASGKSQVSQVLLEQVGAVRVRSDVERKRLFGLAALESSHARVEPGIYDAPTTARTYARLRRLAQTALASGWPVVVDAAFLRRAERSAFASLADALALPFTIIDCRAPPAVLRERLLRRQALGSDASEADVAVLERLIAVAEPLDERELAAAIVVEEPRPEEAADPARQWRSRVRIQGDAAR